MAFAELHCHSHFSFLDGASAPDELVERAVALGLAALAVTDHQGLYGAVRFSTAAEAAGLHPSSGWRSSCSMPAVAGSRRARRARPRVPWRRAARLDRPRPTTAAAPSRAGPARPRPERARLPGHRDPVKEDHRGVGEAQRGPHLVLLARDDVGWRSLCRLVSRANLAGTKAVPRFTQALLAEHTEGVIALSGCRHGEIARRLRAGDREGARAVAERTAVRATRVRRSGFLLELQHHLLPDDDWLVAETARLADGARAADRRHERRPLRPSRGPRAPGRARRRSATAGRSTTLADLRRPDGESYLKGAAELLALPPASATFAADAVAAAWREGIADGGRGRGGVLGRPRVRALPLPGLPGARGRDAVLPPRPSCAGRARAGATTR